MLVPKWVLAVALAVLSAHLVCVVNEPTCTGWSCMAEQMGAIIAP